MSNTTIILQGNREIIVTFLKANTITKYTYLMHLSGRWKEGEKQRGRERGQERNPSLPANRDTPNLLRSGDK